MKQYTVTWVEGSPDWSSIPAISMDYTYETTPEGIRGYGQVCYGADALLVHLWAENTQLRNEEEGLLASPCNDSCLEFFFCPMEGDKRYFNIEYNMGKCKFLGMGSCIQDLVRFVPAEDEDDLFEPEALRTEDGWEIFYRIPYEFIRRFFPEFRAEPGKVIRANCYHCASLGEPPFYLSWSPIVGLPFKFHRPECFGTMTFENH